MREIKFRAWHNKRNVMLGEGFHDNYEYDPEEYYENWDYMALEWITGLAEDKNYNVMQYTGIKDYKGNEVWEGDILEWNDGYETNKYLSEVVYRNGCFISKEGRVTRHIHNYDSGGATTFQFEVIGNIYEHPHLLR